VTDVINKIRQLDGHLHSALQRVADVALADLEFVATATTAEIAERAKVSEPTLTRFCPLELLATAAAQRRADTAMGSLRRIRSSLSALHGDLRESPVGG